jgi:REP element-mobilizing transposase RayT
MTKLSKYNIPGHIHFVTTNVHNHLPLFAYRDICQMLIANLDYYRGKHRFKLLGYVIMPDHFHALIYSEGGVSIEKIVQDIKRYTAKQIRERLLIGPVILSNQNDLIFSIKQLDKAMQTSAKRCLQKLGVIELSSFQVDSPRTQGQEHIFWQESFYDFNVFTEVKLHEKLDYIHRNPLRWHLVEDPCDYPCSSYLNYYREGTDLPICIDFL